MEQGNVSGCVIATLCNFSPISVFANGMELITSGLLDAHGIILMAKSVGYIFTVWLANLVNLASSFCWGHLLTLSVGLRRPPSKFHPGLSPESFKFAFRFVSV